MSNWKVILATFAIFAAGAVAGGALAWKLGSSSERPRELPFDPREMRRGYVSHLDHELNLSDQQEEQISLLLSNSHNRIRLIFEDFNPRMRKEMDQVREGIKALLDKEQRKKFEEMPMRRRGGPRGGDRKDDGPPDRSRDGDKYEERRQREEAVPDAGLRPPLYRREARGPGSKC